jgi:hypothetical protein
LPKSAELPKNPNWNASIQRSAIRNQPPQQKQKNRPKMQFPWGMNYFLRKRFRSGLREIGWLGTLVKDVRDVAAAVMCSEGPGQSGKD